MLRYVARDRRIMTNTSRTIIAAPASPTIPRRHAVSSASLSINAASRPSHEPCERIFVSGFLGERSHSPNCLAAGCDGVTCGFEPGWKTLAGD